MLTNINCTKRRSIKNWNHQDRPREKMLEKTSSSLSNAELLSIIIGSGNRSHSALDLAKIILSSAQDNLKELSKYSPKDLSSRFKGIGEAKAVSIVACMELARRQGISPSLERAKITSSQQAYEQLAKELSFAQSEKFYILMLSRSNMLLGKALVSEGGWSQTSVDPKKIFKFCLEYRASALILAHNHPSGNLKPSEQDIILTKRLSSAAQILDIQILDHIIVGEGAFYSLSDHHQI